MCEIERHGETKGIRKLLTRALNHNIGGVISFAKIKVKKTGKTEKLLLLV